MLPIPNKRKKIHIRKVICEGFKRDDNLWDIEGYLIDTKTYDFKTEYRGEVNSGMAIHNMSIRVTLNDNLLIKDINISMDNYPYETCPAVLKNFKKLVGITVGRGFRKNVYSKVGGIAGCTHLVELLFPIATTAFQTIYSYKSFKSKNKKSKNYDQPLLINTCHSWRENGEVIEKYFPKFYKNKY